MATYQGNSIGPPGVTFYVVVEYNQQEFVTSGTYSGKYHYSVKRYVYVSQNNGAGTWSRTFKTSWTGNQTYTMSSTGVYAESTIDEYISPNQSHSFSYDAGYTSNSGNVYKSTCSDSFVTPQKKFTMTYKANGGIGDDFSEEAFYMEYYVTRDNMFSRPGYTFIGWNESPSGDGIGWTMDIGNNWLWHRASDIVIYAQWRPNTLSIQYNVNSGSLNSSSFLVNSDGYITGLEEPHAYVQTFNYGSVMTNGLLSHNSLGLYKLGYKFIGWSLNSENSENLFDDTRKDYSVTDFSTGIESGDVTITLYAQWKIQNVGYIQVDGKTQLALMYYKENDTWYPAIGYRKVNGSYKQSMA